MFKKMISMVLTVAMALFCMIFANAASEPHMTVAENGDIVYVYDGFNVVISDDPGIQSRAIRSGVATMDEPGEYRLSFGTNRYTYATIEIENVDDEAGMVFTISGTVNNEPVEIEVTNLKAGDLRNVSFKATNNTTLSGSVDTVIEPYRADSVEYKYTSNRS